MPPLSPSVSVDQLAVNTLRFLAVDAVEKAKSGHPGTPMEAAPAAYVLWTRLLRHNPKNPKWPNRDRFILSAGHASMLLYGLLHLTGYDLSLDDIKNFRQWKSRTPGHPESDLTPGVETTTGPLGQGFANGVGLAIAERFLGAKFNRPGHTLVDYFIFAFCSDGDLMEGVASEAASLAGHLKLGKLKYLYLDNRITIDGKTDITFTEDVQKRFEAYGWEVLRVADANDLDALEKAFKTVRSQTQKPSLIILRTHIGFGAPTKQDTPEAHGAPLGPEETAGAKKNLGWPSEPAFHIPPEALEIYRREVEKGTKAEASWNDLFAAYKKAHPDLAAEWEKLQKSPLVPGWEKALPVFKAGEKLATREASGKTINALAPALPMLIGGSADLAVSNNTTIKDGGSFSAENPSGRNLHFGVREHAMGSILNGLCLTQGFLPYGATFLIFTDYMRNPIRLASLSNLGVIYVMTHDSVGLGEDGPTHQPIEQLASLRAIPEMVVLRPADANETAVAWRVALERRHRPTLMALSRQKLVTLDRTKYAPAEGVARGAYVLSPAAGGTTQVLILATGAEVHPALGAQEILAKQNVAAAVVSMPSWELFEQQDVAYKEQVLPSSVMARVAVEAAASLGWHKYVGPRGALVTLDRFGASAPGEVALQNLGFTPDNIAQKALSLLEKR